MGGGGAVAVKVLDVFVGHHPQTFPFRGIFQALFPEGVLPVVFLK